MGNTISFFNNKGGVGKTTTCCNVAAGLAQKFNKNVLLIDLDPQCNSTLLVEGEENISKYYWNDKNIDTRSIITVIEPLLIDEPEINFNSSFITTKHNRFGIDILLGHPKLSMVEDRLGEAWGKVAGGEVGALRKTNWCYSLIKNLTDSYDFIFIDLGPSLGSLNRSALIASDFFVTPMAIDIFSLIGLRNISEWLDEWTTKYERGIKNIIESPHSKYLSQFPISTSLQIKSGFIGYTTQTYISKIKKGVSRPVAAFEKIYRDFNENFDSYLGKFTKNNIEKESLVLGEIPNMYSLAPLSQSNSSPIRGLTSADGIFGAHYSQVEKYKNIFDSIAEKIISNTGGNI